MDTDNDGDEKKLETLFRDVKYYVVGNIPQSVNKLLEVLNGATKQPRNPLSRLVTSSVARSANCGI